MRYEAYGLKVRNNVTVVLAWFTSPVSCEQDLQCYLVQKMGRIRKSGSVESDAVVVGAGPAGAAAAAELAAAGVRVAILDRDPRPGASNACGGAVLFSLCAELGLGEPLLEARLRRAELGRAESRSLRFERSWPLAGAVRRRIFDAALTDRAVALGATLSPRTLVRGVSDDGRTLLAEGPDGATTIRSRLVVFADGPSTRARAIGLGPAPEDPRGVAVRWNLAAPAHGFDALRYDVGGAIPPNGYGWIFPKRDVLNVGVALFGGTNHGRARAILDGYIGADPALRGLRKLDFRGGIVPLRPARRMAAPFACVAGDAAGLVNPITAGGIAPAFRSGRLAGRLAAEVLRGEAHDLRSYGRAVRLLPEWSWFSTLSLALRAAGDGGYRRLFEGFFRATALLSLHERT